MAKTIEDVLSWAKTTKKEAEEEYEEGIKISGINSCWNCQMSGRAMLCSELMDFIQDNDGVNG